MGIYRGKLQVQLSREIMKRTNDLFIYFIQQVSLLPDNLQTVTLTTITNSECVRLSQIPPSNVICTVSPGPGRQGLCFNDGGSPLVVGNFLVGLAIMDMPNCAVGIPDAFTRVNHHITWINSLVN